MNRAKWLIFLLLISFGGAAWAQSISSVMVGTVPTGVVFLVDGVNYTTTQTFLWPQGSKHTIQFPFSLDNNGVALPYQQSLDMMTRYSFSGWTSNGLAIGGGVPVATITADPTLTSVIATLTVQYQVTIVFPSGSNTACAGAPGNPSGTGWIGGLIYFNAQCVSQTTTSFQPAGAVPLIEYPYPGWVFYGWQINNGFYPGPTPTYNITGPTTFTPQFTIAKRVHFLTTPPGLTLLVDRTVTQTPLVPSTNGATCNPSYSQLPPLPPVGFPALCAGDFDFIPGSTHQIGATTPQRDSQSNYWVFQGFTNGTAQNGNYTADSATNVADTVTGAFVPGVLITLISSQPGLQLLVDGRSNYGAYNFVWGQGEKHTLSAPATQVDSKGRTWTFVGWSNGGPATQTLTVPSNTTQFALTATFSVLPQVTINSVPQGLQFSVDGQPCTTPCVVNRAAGSTLQLAAPASISSSAVSRIDFTSWSDGSTATTRNIAFNQDTQTFSATYHASWALIATVSPAGTANFTYSPTTPDGFFPDGTQVTVTVVPTSGNKFLKWAGDFSGTYTTGYLTMTGPHAITAYTYAVPSIAPAGIMSAAGATPDGTMAAGSVISIYGQNLAPGLQIASTNPLPQTLGNITVTIGNYILPLLFVSPAQINAQLPSELVAGNYTLLVHQTGQPDVTGALTVSRDAPGVFTQANAQNLPLVLALHQDGTLITFDSPAIRGETISIYGTGFGPYVTPVIDGFFVPASPATSVADPVTLNIGSITKTPDFAGAAPGAVGLTLVQLKITDDLPTATTINLTVNVNSKLSTTVVLPLQ